MKKILVPTDFSREADNALEVAAQLAKKFEAELYLLHMVELPANMTNPVGEMRSNDLPEALFFIKMARKRFAEVLERPYLKGLKINEIIESEHAFEGIMDTSKKYDCDFIVMGSKGAKGFREMFVGSNTEKVVRTSEVPVLVIKDSHPDFRIKNFAFATNLDEQNRKTLQKVANFAELMDAKLHLVFINTANQFITTKQVNGFLEEHFSGIAFDNYEFHTYNDDSVEEGILNFAAEINADVIGIATHGRKGLAHFFNGSISEDLVNHAKTPIVTFRLEK